MGAEKKMKLLCYGDSNTYGYDPRTWSSGRLPYEKRWTGILDADPRFEVVNEGLNGRCFPRGRAAIASLKRILSDNEEADLVVVMLGTNDLFRITPVSGEIVAYQARVMFEDVPELLEKKVLLICPPKPNIQTGGYEEVCAAADELPAALAAVAGEFSVDFLDAGSWGCGLYLNDVHLNEEGHARFAKELSAYLALENELPPR
ncbi:MAG: hypothetical protein K6E30_04780 [Lachnospiraceae bacterium]|nr:hypothetical protein [Lachnospiraceae bacterium]